mmetsp:Transcript_58590/g.102576  ORF Transcript_58590/g.102576 Transcript_58590/m.102576 type:complete len:222 (+) Transcript_58590:113-778(+)
MPARVDERRAITSLDTMPLTPRAWMLLGSSPSPSLPAEPRGVYSVVVCYLSTLLDPVIYTVASPIFSMIATMASSMARFTVAGDTVGATVAGTVRTEVTASVNAIIANTVTASVAGGAITNTIAACTVTGTVATTVSTTLCTTASTTVISMVLPTAALLVATMLINLTPRRFLTGSAAIARLASVELSNRLVDLRLSTTPFTAARSVNLAAGRRSVPWRCS